MDEGELEPGCEATAASGPELVPPTGVLPTSVLPTSVLIVEDEFLIALQIESILIERGYRVVGIVSDLAGLAAMSEPPDVALVDLNLRDGPTGCAIAAQLARDHGTRIVYVTANPAQIAEPAPTAIGIVHKPFSHGAIDAAVWQAMAARQGACASAMALPVFDGTGV